MAADTDDVLDPTVDSDAPAAPRPKAPPIHSRFLYVDIAAMRAKQLRRGALSRLEPDDLDALHVIPHKAERIAMEEVKRGLVLYDIPDNKKPEF
jgi:DNA-directed RNA polymerase subunit K/omega